MTLADWLAKSLDGSINAPHLRENPDVVVAGELGRFVHRLLTVSELEAPARGGHAANRLIRSSTAAHARRP